MNPSTCKATLKRLIKKQNNSHFLNQQNHNKSGVSGVSDPGAKIRGAKSYIPALPAPMYGYVYSLGMYLPRSGALTSGQRRGT